jgi:hypothetical protein
MSSLTCRLLINGNECPGVVSFEGLGTTYCYSRNAATGLDIAIGRRHYEPLLLRKVWEAATDSPFAKWVTDNEARTYVPSKNTLVLEVAELGVRYTLSDCSIAAYQPLVTLSSVDTATAKGIQEKSIKRSINDAAGELLSVRFLALKIESFAAVPVVATTSRGPLDDAWNFVFNGGR